MNVRFICDHPACELAPWAYGYGDVDLLELAGVSPAPPGTTELPERVACPLCRDATPPRQGTLLAVPIEGELHELLAAVPGPLHSAWQVAEPIAEFGTRRMLSTLEAVKSFGTKIPGEGPPTKGELVLGQKVITAQVLRARPYDGNVLAFGNTDSSTKAGRGPFSPTTAKYGPKQTSPTSGSRANPTYIRELQRDLILLGYFAVARGNPTAGEFDVFTLGAVLALKQDLTQLYGVGTTDKLEPLPEGPLDTATFSTKILSQPAFASPVFTTNAWRAWLTGSNLATTLGNIAAEIGKRLSGAKSDKAAERAVHKVETHVESLEAALRKIPMEGFLEAPHESSAPFEPAAAAATPVDGWTRTPVVDGKPVTPPYDEAARVMKDAVWTTPGFNARDDNRAHFRDKLSALLTALRRSMKSAQQVLAELAGVTPPASVEATWNELQARVETVARTADTVAARMEFWLLNLPMQVQAWLGHIVVAGTVDQATAVYIKAMLAGARVGPKRRPAYRLVTDAEDFKSKDEGAAFLRDGLRGLPSNKGSTRAKTMPEIIALQMYGNESGLTFTSRLGPYCVSATDKDIRFPKLGVDMNCTPARGSFDGVFTAAGSWVHGRGWGLGQETFGDTPDFQGVPLRRGLPIVDVGAVRIKHPVSFTNKEESFASVFEHRVLNNFNKHTNRRDCTFPAGNGAYYDCHKCLERFYTRGWVGKDGRKQQGDGGVFVPSARKSFAGMHGANAFWLDLERVTEFARAGGKPEDPAAYEQYEDLFGVSPPVGTDAVREVLRLPHDRQAGVGFDHKAVGEIATRHGIDRADLIADVKAYIRGRAELPCSWMKVRIRYSGSGGQAVGSLVKLVRIAGKLDADEAVVNRHMKEASELRRKEAGLP
jgi:hypothetical protein